MTESFPPSARPSQVLVSFTVEVDNEFEHRMVDRTTAFDSELPKLTGVSKEANWRARFGDELGAALDAIVGDESLLREGMRPYPDGWRASVRAPAMLPHYPMVLHRGGYPDGS